MARVLQPANAGDPAAKPACSPSAAVLQVAGQPCSSPSGSASPQRRWASGQGGARYAALLPRFLSLQAVHSFTMAAPPSLPCTVHPPTPAATAAAGGATPCKPGCCRILRTCCLRPVGLTYRSEILLCLPGAGGLLRRRPALPPCLAGAARTTKRRRRRKSSSGEAADSVLSATHARHGG